MAFALSWFAELNERIARHPCVWDEKNPPRDPVLPFVTHPVHPRLAELVRRVGVRKRVKAGAPLTPEDSPVTSLAILERGVALRTLGHGGKTSGLTLPGRIAYGNLNFFTSQPCFGSYGAVTECEVTEVPQKLLKGILPLEPGLPLILCTQFELARQSDRLAFTLLSELPAPDRLKAFYLVWCAALGSAERSPDGTEWITAPALPPRRVVARVVSASEVSVGTDAARWRRDGLLESSRQGFRARPALFDSVWEWFGEEEEPGEIRRSGTVEEEMAREGKGEAAR